MDDKLLLALVAAGSAIAGGALTAVIAPWLKHHLERRALEEARRRDQLQRWRAMILQVAQEWEGGNSGAASVGQLLQLHPDYLTLEPLLSGDVRKSLYRRHFIVIMGQSLPFALELVKNDIARIENEWGLV